MKLCTVALVLLVLGSADAFWWGGYGGYGMYGMYGLYGYGMGMYGLYGKRSAEEPMPVAPEFLRNRTECVYMKDATMLSCRGLTGVVECEATLYPEADETSMQFELYGLSRAEEYYRMMPRKPDNSKWLDNVVMVNETRVSAELYYSAEKVERYGLRVADEKCWMKMDELLRASLRNEKVWYTTVEGTEETTVLRGDLILTQAPVMEGKDEKETMEMTKRWWGGFYGGWYWPYGGGYYYGKRSDGPAVEMRREVMDDEMSQKFERRDYGSSYPTEETQWTRRDAEHREALNEEENTREKRWYGRGWGYGRGWYGRGWYGRGWGYGRGWYGRPYYG